MDSLEKVERLRERADITYEEAKAVLDETGGDLLDEGWTYSWYMYEEKQFGMEYGLFTYTVTFEGDLDTSKEMDDEALRPLKVVSIVRDGIGNFTADLDE